ncbi:MAG: glycosyltransferase [Tannerellaceae bacterium]|jgi:glycosyltransferase involved in cell wall biosynthesis|nr:glycosyltransferase [Tannerellaceae bacterium]
MEYENGMIDYIFESSWEVCNKVGGIYTVLSTKARTLEKIYPDRIVFIGPDVWKDAKAPDFVEDKDLFADWKKQAEQTDGLVLKIGRWDIPGKPFVILVDFTPFSDEKNGLYYAMWDRFQVNSLQAYGDYDESCLFAYAAGKVIESFYHFYKLDGKKVIALFNEWMLGMGALYIKQTLPAVATVFTTHATSVGRSIAGNDKPLYSHLDEYRGDAMAAELNMQAKHSLEKQAAAHADCFTTVSDITALECRQLLEKSPDVVTPNGFEPDFVPEGARYALKREEARHTLINMAEKLLGTPLHPGALLVSISGRYEYHNKGIDVFIEAMDKLRTSGELQRDVVAFIMTPAWVRGVRADLQTALEHDICTTAPMQTPFCTHWLHRQGSDKVLTCIAQKGFTNNASERIKIIFVPCYLDGKDGILNKSYYDLLTGMDATVYPSYYEPWGYTPLESIAFGVPTVTTNLAGFGLWARQEGAGRCITQGVQVIDRTDSNYFEVADAIGQAVLTLSREKKAGLQAIRNSCFKLASQAEWGKFIAFYRQAFDIALRNKAKRIG